MQPNARNLHKHCTTTTTSGYQVCRATTILAPEMPEIKDGYGTWSGSGRKFGLKTPSERQARAVPAKRKKTELFNDIKFSPQKLTYFLSALPARGHAKNGKTKPEREYEKEGQKVKSLYLLYYLFCLVY
jgi:hypothetical protein